MRPLQAKFGKICQWTKKIKDAIVYGWGRQIFPKSPKENKNSSNVSATCLFKKIDAQYCLEMPFISVASCATLKRTQNNLAVLIFLGLLDRPKNKIRAGATPPPP